MSADLAILAADTTALEQISDPVQSIVLACERAKGWLAYALEHGDIAGIVETKSQAEAIRVYTMQKNLGKDAELAAAEVVRRAERGIGLAIRKGQEAGEIASRGTGAFGPKADYERNGQTIHVDRVGDAEPISPTRFASRDELTDAYAVTDDVSDEEFNEALAEAKAEGNLSRANVVRKVKPERAPASKADRHDLLHRTRRLDANRVVRELVYGLEGSRIVLDQLTPDDLAVLNDTDREVWATSLSESVRALNRLLRNLRGTA